MSERPDEQHLAYAAEQKMALLGYNVRDYVRLAHRWTTEGRSYSGIVLSDQFSLRQLGELLRRVLNLLNRVPADDMANTVRYLSDYK